VSSGVASDGDVLARGLRLEVVLQREWSAGIQEWKVQGEGR
jgi:hypothetical protein